MGKQQHINDGRTQIVLEERNQAQYGFRFRSEDEKLLEDIFRSDKEKLSLFTDMLCREKMFNEIRVNTRTF